MEAKTLEFIVSQSKGLARRLTDQQKKEIHLQSEISQISWDRRSLYTQAKVFLEMVENNQEVCNNEIENMVFYAKDYVYTYERAEAESPVNALLNWSSMSGTYGESFILAQSYDLLGKDDARTLRALIREVAIKADPNFAGDV